MGHSREEWMDYKKEQAQNEEVFRTLIRTVRPELAQLLDTLDTTGIDPQHLVRVARQMNNIACGLQYGTVTVTIEKGQVTYIRGEESDRVYQPLIQPKVDFYDTQSAGI